MAEWVHKGSLMGPQGPKGDTGETGPKGDAGETGPKGETGATGATPVISMTATVDQTTGTPSIDVSKSGSDEAPSFNLAITGIKGEKGDKGETGDRGPQGETGPQGPKGADATLPEGGTTGQVLTKTADGEAWEDAPETDLTGYLSIDENNILQTTDGGTKSPTYIKVKTSPIIEAYTHIASGSVTASTKAGLASIEATCGDTYARLVSQYDWPASIETNGELKMGSKSVSSITDTISTSPSGNALATDKAVADYVDANASTVKTASNQDFCEYFGMEYNAEDWS